jgi:hypothetical protein
MRLFGAHVIDRHEVDPAALAAVLRELIGSDLGTVSLEARRFVERAHSWPAAFADRPAGLRGEWPLQPRVESNGHDQTS